MKKPVFFSLLLLCSTILCGCVTDYASVEDEQKAKLYRLKEANTANIYIYRPEHVYGSMIKKRVFIDGKYIADLKSNTFIVKSVKPGEHIVSTRSEFGNNHISFKAKPGRNYFIKQNIKYGVFTPGSGIRLVNYKEAMKDIENADLVEYIEDDDKDIDKEDFNELKNNMKKNKKKTPVVSYLKSK